MARLATDELGHDFIASSHLLIGWSRVERSHELLRCLGVEPNEIERGVRELTPPGKRTRKKVGQLPFAPEAKRVLELAAEHAHSRESRTIALEDLLVGLFRVPRATSSAALARLGLSEERLAALFPPRHADEGPPRV